MRALSLVTLVCAVASCGGDGEDVQRAALRPPPGAGSGEIPEICWRERTAALTELARVRGAYLDCSVDGDCVAVDVSNGCDITCPAAVNRHGRGILQRALQFIDHAYCDDYAARGCPPSIVKCLPTRVVCIKSRCAPAEAWQVTERM